MKKEIVSMLIVITLLASLTACGGNAGGENTASSDAHAEGGTGTAASDAERFDWRAIEYLDEAHTDIWLWRYTESDDGWVLGNLLDESAERATADMAAYNMNTEETVLLPITEETMFGTQLYRDKNGLQVPVSKDGLLVICSSQEEDHGHSVYDLNRRELLTDGQYTFLGEFDGQDLMVARYMENGEKKATWLDRDYREIDHVYPDAASFRNGYALIRAEDGMCYVINDDFAICSEPFAGDSVSAIGYDFFTVEREGGQYLVQIKK